MSLTSLFNLLRSVFWLAVYSVFPIEIAPELAPSSLDGWGVCSPLPPASGEGMEEVPTLLPYTFLYLTDQPYLKLFLDTLLILALCAILASVAYLLSLFISKDAEKASPYECGFAPFDSATRLPFDVHFYLVAILFLIFDVEIACIFPWALQLEEEGWWQIAVLYAFLLILTIGFLYEWRRGALVWAIRRKPAPAPQQIGGEETPSPLFPTVHPHPFPLLTDNPFSRRGKIFLPPHLSGCSIKAVNRLPASVLPPPIDYRPVAPATSLQITSAQSGLTPRPPRSVQHSVTFSGGSFTPTMGKTGSLYGPPVLLPAVHAELLAVLPSLGHV